MTTMTTAPDTGFKLAPLIKQVLAESESVEIDDLALEVLEHIKNYDHETALYQALRSLVRETWRPSFIPTEQDIREETPQPVGGKSRPRQSAKVTAIREAWRKALRQRIATGDGHHKFLADCTALDLEFAAQQREDHAKRTAARAAELRRLAEVMREHGAEKLSDVPAEVLSSMQDTIQQAAA